MDAEALQCNICPKRARFSDVSHLLTHVSSKAHLSHYFKLQVRSHQEIQARNLLDEYDRWYKANNLAKLLSDRMASKEARKRKSHGNSLALATSLTARRGAGSRDTPRTICPPSHQPLPEFLDPRLSDPHLNGNPIVRSGDASLSTHHETSASSSAPDPQFLVRAGYTLHSNDPSQELAPDQCKHEPDFESEEEGVSNTQVTPSRSMKLESRSANAFQPLSTGSVDGDPFVDDSGSFDYLRLVEGDKERADEMTRLKGVLWPGMDIFDSATEQMRRKRNQKKDESILKMMEKTSMCVEPTELVFSPTGILRKQRVISGNVEDSSPLKGETPIPKRRAPRPKRALSQVDSNVPRGQDRKRIKKAAKRTATRRESGLVRYDSQASRNPGAQLPYKYGVHLRSSYEDETEEFSLAVNGLESRARIGFTVFQDESSQHISSYDEPYPRFGVSSPSREPFFGHGATAERRVNRFSGNHAPLPSGRVAHASEEQENIDPMLDAHRRVKSPLLWQSSMVRPQHAGDTSYTPQYFFEEAQSNGLSPFESHGFYAGYTFNPLAISTAKLPTENPIFDADGRHPSRLHSMTRATSPEATISDVEEDDFEQLYLDTSSL
ncbi:uncharacterized protein CDV56_108960 [Aspergillus thermomutatus]|uniref:Uncharacterized protein n=1 Tax=Aspergillus thermomutatus TaxID=41047 RepID=A0A397HXE2_ASPTH|nr:uncharacterized protein CDV56_108960 [Aspergillus thermomutatus]RHZ67939.1 hypothetical protein CDV56_108960 [Aspergillus thermomutatus]